MNLKSYIVYAHTTPSNKKYIGITSKKPETRWQNGVAYRRHNHFYNAIKKYGWDNIKHEILYTNLDSETAKRLEHEIILKYKTNDSRYGYNKTSGGDGVRDWKPTTETKKKMSESKMGSKNHFYGKTHNKKSRGKMSTANIGNTIWLGRHHTEETKNKISNANKGKVSSFLGKHHTEETKQKLSEIKKEYYKDQKSIEKSREVNPHKKTVYQYDLNGELVKIWSSRHQAENEFIPNKKSLAIGKCCIGDCLVAYGFYWSYNKINDKSDIPQSKHMRNVYQYDLEYNLVKIWENLHTAVNGFREGIKSTVISQCVTGHKDKAYGYIWSY